jgi:hypothetical protein
MKVAFTAVEYWTENYATAGRDSDAPNAMWKRRPRGQIAKCAEAQALRKAFPELGSQPTADETVIDPSDVDPGVSTPSPAFSVGKKAKSAAADVSDAVVADPQGGPTAAPKPAAAPTVPPKAAAPAAAAPGPNTAGLVGLGEIAYLRSKAKAAGLDLAALLAEMGGLVLEKLTKADFDAVKARLRELEG